MLNSNSSDNSCGTLAEPEDGLALCQKMGQGGYFEDFSNGS